MKGSAEVQNMSSFNFCVKNQSFTFYSGVAFKALCSKIAPLGVCICVYMHVYECVCLCVCIFKTDKYVIFFLLPFSKASCSIYWAWRVFLCFQFLAVLTQFWFNTVFSQDPYFYCLCSLFSLNSGVRLYWLISQNLSKMLIVELLCSSNQNSSYWPLG